MRYDFLDSLIVVMNNNSKNIIHLNSTALKMLRYNEGKHILTATFSNERTYHYINVPKKLWKDFVAVIHSGRSAGAFMNKYIKPFYKSVEIT
jgi:hypothetical protein